MFKGTFNYETYLENNINEVWSFFSSAVNLVRMTRFPKVSLHSNPSTVRGSHLQFILNFGLFRLNWLLIIQDVQDRSFFIDEALHIPFPFRAWRHTHSFIQQEDHTLMIDKIEFDAYIPAFIIRFLLRRMFFDRESSIKKLLR
jgi:ligand-binding SRPBCC domain-containing protein